MRNDNASKLYELVKSNDKLNELFNNDAIFRACYFICEEKKYNLEDSLIYLLSTGYKAKDYTLKIYLDHMDFCSSPKVK